MERIPYVSLLFPLVFHSISLAWSLNVLFIETLEYTQTGTRSSRVLSMTVSDKGVGAPCQIIWFFKFGHFSIE